jgi:hypothetical protein
MLSACMSRCDLSSDASYSNRAVCTVAELPLPTLPECVFGYCLQSNIFASQAGHVANANMHVWAALIYMEGERVDQSELYVTHGAVRLELCQG